jgi:hypothetical protein
MGRKSRIVIAGNTVLSIEDVEITSQDIEVVGGKC